MSVRGVAHWLRLERRRKTMKYFKTTIILLLPQDEYEWRELMRTDQSGTLNELHDQLIRALPEGVKVAAVTMEKVEGE